MGPGSSLVVGLAALIIAIALVWLARLYSYTRFMNAGLVFALFPAVVLVLISFGLALVLSALF
jgi:hypothetical protein